MQLADAQHVATATTTMPGRVRPIPGVVARDPGPRLVVALIGRAACKAVWRRICGFACRECSCCPAHSPKEQRHVYVLPPPADRASLTPHRNLPNMRWPPHCLDAPSVAARGWRTVRLSRASRRRGMSWVLHLPRRFEGRPADFSENSPGSVEVPACQAHLAEVLRRMWRLRRCPMHA